MELKEKEGKLFYELYFEFIELMAERMAANKGKYEPFNWLNNDVPVEDLLQATFRHLIQMMKGKFEDDGRKFGHPEAIACNAMMIVAQLKRQEEKQNALPMGKTPGREGDVTTCSEDSTLSENNDFESLIAVDPIKTSKLEEDLYQKTKSCGARIFKKLDNHFIDAFEYGAQTISKLKQQSMRPSEKALENLVKLGVSRKYVSVEIINDQPVIKFTIQSKPVAEAGKVDGVQVTDILRYTKLLYEELNKLTPCEENGKTIQHIDEAIVWQDIRTQKRIFSGVEGIDENKYTRTNPFGELTKQGPIEDFSFYPLEVHYTSDNGEHYLYHWVGDYTYGDNFLSYKISKEDLLNYMTGKADLYDIARKANQYCHVITHFGKDEYYKLCTIEDLDEDWLPGKGSYYDLTCATPYSKSLLRKLQLDEKF